MYWKSEGPHPSDEQSHLMGEQVEVQEEMAQVTFIQEVFEDSKSRHVKCELKPANNLLTSSQYLQTATSKHL